MIAAGIDSADLTGFAVLQSGPADLTIARHGAVKLRAGDDVEHLVSELAALSPALVAIEQPEHDSHVAGAGVVKSAGVAKWPPMSRPGGFRG
jgi:hypothetical protein